MDNYEYIVASLPELSQDPKNAESIDPEGLIAQIRALCSEKDCALMDFLAEGFCEEKLCEDFYRRAAKASCHFIRDYFAFDLLVRNAKVRYLNSKLGRPTVQDIFMEEEKYDRDETKVIAAFATQGLLEREKAIDDLMWGRISEIVIFDYFNVNTLLGFIAKLHIITRWLRLDPAKGQEMFRRLVGEVRGTFKGIENQE